MPWYDVPATETPTADEIPALEGLILDMKELAAMETGPLVEMLRTLPAAYESWIDDLVKQANDRSSPGTVRWAGEGRD